MKVDLAEMIEKFSLVRNELSGAILDMGDLKSGIRECKDSLIGRVMGEKVVNFTDVKNFVTAAYGYPKNLTILEIGPNLFQFKSPTQRIRK